MTILRLLSTLVIVVPLQAVAQDSVEAAKPPRADTTEVGTATPTSATGTQASPCVPFCEGALSCRCDLDQQGRVVHWRNQLETTNQGTTTSYELDVTYRLDDAGRRVSSEWGVVGNDEIEICYQDPACSSEQHAANTCPEAVECEPAERVEPW